MVLEKSIDDLIQAGWNVLDSDFDPEAFRYWRQQALNCLTELLGPEHSYTRSFKNYVREAQVKSLLAGGGILAATKEGLHNGPAN